MNQPKRTSSGKHEAVRAFRKKLESVQDGTLEELLQLNRQLDVELERKDPRRDGDEEIPVDIVDLDPEEKL